MVFQKITYPKYETGILGKPAAKTPSAVLKTRAFHLGL